MPDVSKFELASQLQPGESVCYCARRTRLQRGLALAILPIIYIWFGFYEFVERTISGVAAMDGVATIGSLVILALLVAVKWSTPSGEIITTNKRIISKFNNHAKSEIYLDGIKIAQKIWSLNYTYYKITINDGSISRVIVFGDHNDFADCLSSHVALYKTRHAVKGGIDLTIVFCIFVIFSVLAAFALSVWGLVVANAAFDGVTKSPFWSGIIIFSALLGPMIACAYFGALLGISLVFARIKGRFSLQEAKDLAIYGMALDFDAPSRLTMFMSKCLRPHLERTLSKTYGQIVRLY